MAGGKIGARPLASRMEKRVDGGGRLESEGTEKQGGTVPVSDGYETAASASASAKGWYLVSFLVFWSSVR